MLPIFAHYLGTEGYGIFGMIDVITSILTVVVGYGLLGGMQRFYYERETEDEKNTLMSSAIIVTVFIVFIVCIPAIILKKQISFIAFGSEDLSYYVFLAVVSFFFEMTAMSASGYLLIKQKSMLFTLFSIKRFFLSFVLNIYFLIYLEMGVLGLLYSALISVIVYSALLHWYAIKFTGIKFSMSDARDIVKFNLPLIPGYAAGLVRNDADRVILRAFLGLSQLGTYNMLLKFSSLIALFIVQPFLRIWAVKRLEVCEEPDGPVLMARMFTFQFALMLFAALVIALEVPLILKIMTPEKFWVPGSFALLAALSKVLFGAYFHFNFGLIYEKITYKISMVQIAAAVFGVLLNIVFIKYFNIFGALVASNATILFQCVLVHQISKKYYAIPFEWFKVVGLFVMTSLLFLFINSLEISKYMDYSTFVGIVSEFIVDIIVVFPFEITRDSLSEQIVIALPYVIEGVAKSIMSLSYLGVLMVCGLITFSQLRHLMRSVTGKLAFSFR